LVNALKQIKPSRHSVTTRIIKIGFPARQMAGGLAPARMTWSDGKARLPWRDSTAYFCVKIFFVMFNIIIHLSEKGFSLYHYSLIYSINNQEGNLLDFNII
jgi:hypothetical protein